MSTVSSRILLWIISIRSKNNIFSIGVLANSHFLPSRIVTYFCRITCRHFSFNRFTLVLEIIISYKVDFSGQTACANWTHSTEFPCLTRPNQPFRIDLRTFKCKNNIAFRTIEICCANDQSYSCSADCPSHDYKNNKDLGKDIVVKSHSCMDNGCLLRCFSARVFVKEMRNRDLKMSVC